ncbi:alpha-2-macroglobulin family protein [Vibrio sp. MEBiC08052]|uniref:alpha-2-macroglobulin family protein n=1 Tax=Vibrio sp. MEBiC08052 TaxID=1761910 RepID=UPI000740808C|nr:alpha-2-macroglobulin [Vibrio sp. MEBiC08052]KUI99717.1 alpha-2-macroglobulin domain-containing protein [Vibrio sp. MEBiC08052]
MLSFLSRFHFIWMSLLLLSSTLQAADFYVSDISETTQDDAPALVIRFTSPVNTETDLRQFVVVTPSPTTGNIWIPQNNGRQWVLPFVEPSTEYTINVDKRLQSVGGITISEKDSEGNVHQFERTVKTREIVPGANFADKGTFLVGNIQNGIPVTVINQKSVDLDVFRVRDDALDRFTDETSFQGMNNYYRLQNLKEYAELVHTARYENDAKTNQRKTYNFNLDPVLEKNAPGIYVAVIRKVGDYDYAYDTAVFTITDIGLHVRKYKDSLIVYSHSIATAKPMANVNLRFLWPKTNKQAAHEQTGKTALDGSYQLATNDLPKVVVARQGDSISFLKLDEGELDLSAYPNVPSLHRHYQMFMYGPRDLYRPGEAVSINLLLRDFDGQKVAGLPLTAKLYDARGERKKQFTWQPESTNLYQTGFQLDDNASTGKWRLEVSMNDDYVNTYWFQVEDFLPETLTLSFYDGVPNQTRYAPTGGEFDVPIQADYLYGAPAAGNHADAVITVSPSTSPFPSLKNYYFGNAKEKINGRTVKTAAIKLNQEGKGEIAVPANWSRISVPLQYIVSASVYESGGRPVTRNQQVIQLPGYDKLVGIQPQFQGRPASDDTVQFKLLSVNQQGKSVTDQLSVRMSRKYREYFWEYNESRGWYWNYKSHIYTVGSEKVDVKGDPITVDFPVQWGTYILEVTSTTGAKTTFEFETEWSWGNQNSSNLKPDMLQMALDKDRYEPGEIAKLRLTSPIAGDGIINVESTNGVQYSLHQHIQKGENEVSIDIQKSWNRHDLYVTAMVLTPADQVTEVAPKRALGITHLAIIRPDAIANVELTTKDKTQPDKVVNAHIKVTNLAKLGEQKLYATVALVDQGVLNITRYQPPRPELYFYAPRRFESAYYDIYGKIINNLGYDMIRQKFGGDGFDESDEALSRGGKKPKSDVQIVSFFSEPVALTNGEADVSFELPSFNGKLEWMVVVYGDHSYGSADKEMIVADKVVSQIAMPRFLAMGDKSQVSLDLHNLSDTDQTLQVNVAVSGALTSEGLQQTLALADKEKTVLTIPITGADIEGQGVIKLNASNGDDINITRTWRLGVRSPYPWVTNQSRATLKPGEQWQPDFDLSELRDSSVQAMLTISNRPAINFRSQFENLLQYPYGCLEQTTSSTYPWLLLNEDMVTKLGLKESIEQQFQQPFSEAFRLEQIRKGIEKLKAKQLSHGGFGYWDSSSWESRWGTVYATEFLIDARKQGLVIDDDMLKRAIQRLTFFVNNAPQSEMWSESPDYYQFSYRAYAAFVLAKANAISLGFVRRLYHQAMTNNDGGDLSKPIKLNQSGLAWMHLAGALHQLNDTSRAQKSLELALKIDRKRDAYYRDYGSVVRDQALSLAVALELGLDDGTLADKMVDSMQDKRWFSTQERIALLKVAYQYAQKESQWHATIQSSSNEQSVVRKQAFNSVFDADRLRQLKGITAHDQKLYVSLQYQGAPKGLPQPSSDGLRINRQYYDLKGQPTTPATLTSGDLVIVELSVMTTDKDIRIPDALVVDLLPAGLALENQNLSNASVDLDSIMIDEQPLGRYFRENQVQYQEYRDDRFVAAVSLNNHAVKKLYYLARAVTPGIYQVAPPFAEDMYRPNYRAVGTSIGTMEIQPR